MPVGEGFERVISGNSCPKGLVEDVGELRVVKARIEERKHAYPNVGEMVRDRSLPRRQSHGLSLRVGIPRVLNIWSTHQFWLGLPDRARLRSAPHRFLRRHQRRTGPRIRPRPRHRRLLLSGEVHVRALRRTGVRPETRHRHPAVADDPFAAFVPQRACGQFACLSAGDGGAGKHQGRLSEGSATSSPNGGSNTSRRSSRLPSR